MPLASDHSCSDCTKPYKPGPEENEEEIEDAMPVNMIVMDGIVTRGVPPSAADTLLAHIWKNT